MTITWPAGSPSRGLFATFDDVAAVTLWVSTRYGPSRYEVIDRSVLTSGVTSFSFLDLPPGEYAVQAFATSADDRAIGEGRAVVMLADQAVAQVAVPILLVPTVETPRQVGTGGPTP